MSQVLGEFELLDFTMLRPVLTWLAFVKHEPFISLIFQFWVGRGHGKPRLGGDRLCLDYYHESLLSNCRVVPHNVIRSLRPTSKPLPDHCALNIGNCIIWNIVTVVK
jgi:hypothetical protein